MKVTEYIRDVRAYNRLPGDVKAKIKTSWG
jgi:hypothetical protein